MDRIARHGPAHLLHSAQFNSLTNIWKPQPDENTGEVTAIELAFTSVATEFFRLAFFRLAMLPGETPSDGAPPSEP